MKRHSLTRFVSGFVLGLLIVVGLSCVASDRSPTATPFDMTESELKAYITANSTLVLDCLQDILGDPPYELTNAGFDAVRDWVAVNIDYVSDEEQWGVLEYWQTPEETLSLHTGDCEDFAILLCTLLRAYGIGEEHIYVAVGIDNEGVWPRLPDRGLVSGWRMAGHRASGGS